MAKSDDPPKDLRTRLQEEREQRITAQKIENQVLSHSRGGGLINPERLKALREADFNIRHPQSPKKQETVQRHQTELRGPTRPTRSEGAQPTETLQPLKFYVWKEGKTGTVQLGMVTDFEELK